jgi:transcriptional regulator with XRE-family HTH domain
METQDKVLNSLAFRVRKLRNSKNLTLEKLAYQNGISKGNLSDIENKKRSPSLYTLVKIANGLNCRVKDLLDF